MIRPALFLDIDGVLLSGDELWGSKDPRYLPERKIELLNHLCMRSMCAVVISSTWRMHPETPERLRKAGWTGHLHEDWRTPDLAESHYREAPYARRGIEIRAWLRRHPEVKHYAIIDDDHDMLPEQKPHFVQVRFTSGLLMGHTSLAAAIMDGCMIGPSSQATVRCEEMRLAA